MSKLAILAATIWIVLAGGANTASAADLHGVVKDAKGGVLPGVQVVLLTPQRAIVGTTSTDETGCLQNWRVARWTVHRVRPAFVVCRKADQRLVNRSGAHRESKSCSSWCR